MDVTALTDDQLRDLLADLARHEDADWREPWNPTNGAAIREALRWLAGEELATREQAAALKAGGH